MSVAQALRDAAARLAATSDTPRLDAELLMAHALGTSRSEMLVRHMDDAVPDTFAALMERRARHEPVAYITGTQEFHGLEFTVTRDVLIPRSDSEVLVDAAVAAARPGALRILDCGTGPGTLLLAVLSQLPQAEGIGIDRSREALGVATANAAALAIGCARFLDRDWSEPGWAEGLGTFDLILANPPYVETGAELAPSVREFEPAGALFAGSDGLDAYRALLPQLPFLLCEDGLVFVEIGASQADDVSAIAAEAGFAVRLHRDLANRPRVLELTQAR